MGSGRAIRAARPENGEAIASWQNRVACRRLDAQLFFGPDDERQTEREICEVKAKPVCEWCTDRYECLNNTLPNTMRHGIWRGGSQLPVRGTFSADFHATGSAQVLPRHRRHPASEPLEPLTPGGTALRLHGADSAGGTGHQPSAAPIIGTTSQGRPGENAIVTLGWITKQSRDLAAGDGAQSRKARYQGRAGIELGDGGRGRYLP
jgi:WhiB family redox-sensing transcriptional regulator